MFRIHSYLWLLAILIALSSPVYAQNGSDADRTGERTVKLIPYDTTLAVYGDKEIGLGEFFHYQSRSLDRLESANEEERKQIIDNAIQQMFFERAICQIAMDEGYGKDEEYVRRSRDMFMEYLAAFYTYHQFSKNFKPSDDELKEMYDKVKESKYFQPTKFSFRHIFLRTVDLPEDVQKQAAVKAKEAKALIASGSDFEQVAKLYSDSERKGAVVGPFYLREYKEDRAINPVLEAEILKLKPGDVSDIIETKYGYEIIKLETFNKAGYTPFEQVKTTLAGRLRGEKLEEWKKKLVDNHWDEAKVEFHQDNMQLTDPKGDEVIATVYDDSITTDDFRHLKSRAPKRTPNMTDAEYEEQLNDFVKYDVIFNFIAGKLARDAGYMEIERLKLLTNTRRTKTVYNIWWNKMLDEHEKEHPITEEVKKSFYEENKRYFKESAKARVGVMTFNVPEHDEDVMYEVYKAEQAAKDKAQKAIDRVLAGEAFADVAKDMSEDDLAASGGEIGVIDYSTDKLPRSVAREVLALKPAEINHEPLKNEDKFYVFTCYEKPERAIQAYDEPEVQDRLNRAVQTKVRNDYYKEKLNELVDPEKIQLVFKDIYTISPTQVEQSSLDLPEEESDSQTGFVPLFEEMNAKSEKGWIVQGLEKAGPKVLDGDILSMGGWDYWAVISKQEYKNFVLKFDVKYDSRGNSGVLLHTPAKAIYKKDNRLEIQLESGDDAKIKDPKSKSGAIERFVAPKSNPAKPIGEWNEVEIKYVHPKVWVTINGEVVQDGVDISKIDALKNHPKEGHIALQRNDFKKAVYFKNILIKKLP